MDLCLVILIDLVRVVHNLDNDGIKIFFILVFYFNNANTLIVHRANMFGLSQLYQIRGRVGRSKIRAYCYLTYEQKNKITKQLVLIGGAHAKVQVLKKLCKNNIKGLHTILISEHFEATYSGMTPGFIHEDFSKEEISIDLQRLCFNAGATFIRDKVTKLDSNNNELQLQNLPPINYDLLSINTGSISNTKKINLSLIHI